MRIILNDNILVDKDFLSLEKNEIITLIRVISLFANTDKDRIKLNLLKIYGIDDTIIDKFKFCIDVEDDEIFIKEYFSWFKGNKEKVNKSRSKNKVEIVDDIDYERIIINFNDKFKDFKTPKLNSRIIGKDRKKQISKFYSEMQQHVDENIYDFYDIYFTILSQNEKLTTGWINTASPTKNWFQPNFDFFLREKTFIDNLPQ